MFSQIDNYRFEPAEDLYRSRQTYLKDEILVKIYEVNYSSKIQKIVKFLRNIQNTD